MSKFLAPIHGWLFNKILILETIEKELVNALDSKSLVEKHDALLEEYDQYIPDQPLAEIIDQSNIHGWLQKRISISETRQAAFVNELILDNHNAVEAIMNVYRKVGVSVAKEANLQIDDPTEIFNALNNVLLEGMPCDRVNAVIEQNEQKIIWKTQNCVHKTNWEAGGTDVGYFYKFREAFTRGFVQTVNGNFNYNYLFEKEQVHEITRK